MRCFVQLVVIGDLGAITASRVRIQDGGYYQKGNRIEKFARHIVKEP